MPNFTPIGVDAQVRGLSAFTRNLGKMDTSIQKTGKSAQGVGKQFLGLGDKVLGVGATMAKVAAGGVAAIGAGIVGIGTASTKMASDFDSAMRNVNSIAQLSESQFQSLSDEVVAFSLTSRASAADVASALYNVVSAGLDLENAVEVPITKVRELADGSKELYVETLKTSEGMAVLQLASRAAGAGLATTEDTSRLLISAIRAYNLEMSEAGDVTDLFLYTVNKGLTTLPELANDLGRVLPTAHAAGISLEELTAATALLTQKGLATHEATTALNSAFVAILKPSTALQQTFEDAGYASGVAAIEALGFSGVMGLLANASGGAADEIAAMFGNIRAQRAVFNLATEDAAELNAMIVDFGENAAGAVERARLEQYKTFSAQLAKLKGAFEAVGITIGKLILPPLTDLVKRIQPLVVEFGKNLPDAIQIFRNMLYDLFAGGDLGEALSGGIKQLGELFNIPPEVIAQVDTLAQKMAELGQIVTEQVSVAFRFLHENVFPVLVQVIQLVMEHWEAFKGALIAIGAVLAAAGIAAAIAGIVGTIMALVNPITLIIGAAALLGAAWAENWYGIRDTLTNFWETTAQPVLSQLVEWLQTNIPIAVQAASEFWQTTLLPALTTAWNFIQTSVIPALSTLWSWLAENVPIALQTLAGFWETTLLPAIQTVGTFLTGTLIPIISQVVTWLADNLPLAGQEASSFFTEKLIPAIQMLADFFAPTIERLIIGFQGFLEALAPLGSQIQEFMPVLAELAEIIGIGVVVAIKLLGETVALVLPHVGELFANIVSTAIGVISGFVEFLSGAIQMIKGLFEGDMEEARAGAERVLGGLLDVFRSVFQGILGTVEPVIGLISDLLERLGILQGIDLTSLQLPEGLQTVADQAAEGIGDLGETLGNLKLPDFLQSDSPTPLETGLCGIGNALSSVIPAALQVFGEQSMAVFSMVHELVVTLDQALTLIWQVTMPQLQVVTRQTTEIMIATFTSVQPILEQVNVLLSRMDSLLQSIASSAKKAADAMRDGFSAAADKIKDRLLDVLDDLIDKLDDVREAAEEAASAVDDIGDASPSTASSPGFQRGANFVVPPGFPRDTFPMRVSSGERVIVIPPGEPGATSVGGETNFNMTVNTLASPASIIQQFEVMRALVG